MNQNARRYITIPAGCECYSISRNTWYRLFALGAVKAVKRGRRTLIDVDSADAYFDALPPAEIKAPSSDQRRIASQPLNTPRALKRPSKKTALPPSENA